MARIRKLKLVKSIIWTFVGIILAGMPGLAAAAELAETQVRPESMKTGESPLPILVTVKTGTDRVENQLRITTGTAFSVNQNPVAVTVDTMDLPSGVLPWPGLGVSGVTGKQISFSSSNLNSASTYGFFITGGVESNPQPGDSDGYKWLIEVLDSSNLGDQREIKVPIVGSDQVTVTGRVGALASDFQLEMEADKTMDLKVGDEVKYTIRYGSYLKNVTRPLLVTASWTRGTIEGAPTPSVDIAEYVIGSGTSGHSGTNPVIDLVNRKITWTINSFPAETTDKEVSFRLRVTDNYGGSSPVRFDVSAELNGANVVTTSALVENVFVPPVVPTATMAPSPTPTAGPTPTSGQTTSGQAGVAVSTPTPTLVKVIPAVESIKMVKLGEREAVVRVLLNKAAKVRVIYGETSINLNKLLTGVDYKRSHDIEFEGLKVDKNYYFRLSVEDEDGQKINSETFVFRTAARAGSIEIDPKSVSIAVENTVVFDAHEVDDPVATLVVAPDLAYSLRLYLPKPEEVKSISLFTKDSRVLGINTVYGAEPNPISVDLAEFGDGGYVGQLRSPGSVGFYEVIAVTADIYGNMAEQKLCTLRVVEPMVIVGSDNRGVENAKVTFYKYNDYKRMYELIGSQVLSFKNPHFTDNEGKIKVFLPVGRYRAQVEEIGYEPQSKEFIIGLGENEGMPRIQMLEMRPGMANTFKYYMGVVTDMWEYSGNFVSGIGMSWRVYRLSSVLVGLTFLGLTIQVLAVLLKVEWWMLPYKMWKTIRMYFENNKDLIGGRVIDKTTKRPVPGAKVFLLDSKYNKIIGTVVTDILGEYKLPVPKLVKFRMAAQANGYETTPMHDFSREGLLAGKLDILIENIISPVEKVELAAGKVIGLIAGFVVLVWLLALVILESVFTKNFGMEETWLPMVLAIMSLCGYYWIIIKGKTGIDNL